MPKISIIIPAYNAAARIESCLKAVLSQEFDPGQYEVIAVDNNSSDDSRTLIRRYPRVRLLEEPVQSSYAARNRGVRESTGEILAFTDADCVPAPHWLREMAAAMENPGTQVVLGSRGAASGAGAARLLAAYDNTRISYIVEQRRKGSYFGFTNNMAVRRNAFDHYGPFQVVARGADTLFLRRVASYMGAGAVDWCPDMSIRHLELRNPWIYLRKNFIYARARKQTGVAEDLCENLAPRESLRIFMNASRGSTIAEKMTLALVLFTGKLTWLAGSLL